MQIQKITLEINSSIYDYIMFFLENIPKNLLSIKKDVQSKIKKPLLKELPSGFLNPMIIDSYRDIASRDELYDR